MLHVLTVATVTALAVGGTYAFAAKFLWRRGKSLREP